MVKSKTRFFMATSIILLLVTIVSLILLIPATPESITGGSQFVVKSIDYVDRISNDANLNKPHWRILAQMNGGEKIVGIIDKDRLQSDLPLGLETETDLEISANIDTETAFYPISADTSDVGKWFELLWYSVPDAGFGSTPADCTESEVWQTGDKVLFNEEY